GGPRASEGGDAWRGRGKLVAGGGSGGGGGGDEARGAGWLERAPPLRLAGETGAGARVKLDRRVLVDRVIGALNADVFGAARDHSPDVQHRVERPDGVGAGCDRGALVEPRPDRHHGGCSLRPPAFAALLSPP